MRVSSIIGRDVAVGFVLGRVGGKCVIFRLLHRPVQMNMIILYYIYYIDIIAQSKIEHLQWLRSGLETASINRHNRK